MKSLGGWVKSPKIGGSGEKSLDGGEGLRIDGGDEMRARRRGVG